MTAIDIKTRIASLTDDIQFCYNGNSCFINPYNKYRFELSYVDIDRVYTDIDDLMSDPIFDGKPLDEIAGEIELL